MKGIFQGTRREVLNLTGDVQAEWFDCSLLRVFMVFVEHNGVVGTAGEYVIEGTFSLPPDATATTVRFANADLQWWRDGVLGGSPVLASTEDADLLIAIVNPLRFMRLAWVDSGGSTAAQGEVFTMGRQP